MLFGVHLLSGFRLYPNTSDPGGSDWPEARVYIQSDSCSDLVLFGPAWRTVIGQELLTVFFKVLKLTFRAAVHLILLQS